MSIISVILAAAWAHLHDRYATFAFAVYSRRISTLSLLYTANANVAYHRFMYVAIAMKPMHQFENCPIVHN